MSIGRVLVVDDDPQILKAVRTSLQARGYEVVPAPNGETALDALTGTDIDLVILDLELPGMNGHEVIRRLRTWSDVPVIMLTVQEAQRDKVTALDAGADDYITKPFDMAELLARMRAVHRRSSTERSSPVLLFDGLEIDRARQRVRMDGQGIRLTPTEYRLLEALASNPGKLLTHSWLLREVWGPGYENESQYLRVFVRALRRKLSDDPVHPRWIETEPSLGYRWAAELDPDP